MELCQKWNEEGRKGLARALAEESFVLLKNYDSCLPLPKGKVAFFGSSFHRPVLEGMGSGMSFWGKDIPSLQKACELAGLEPVASLENFYREELKRIPVFDIRKEIQKAGPDLVASGAIYEIFGKYHGQPEEPLVPETLVKEAADQTDTALLILGRGAGGEECDRRKEDDFYLQERERQLLERVCKSFPRVVVLLNINGVMDISWIPSFKSIQAVLYIGVPGEQGPAALADVLTGSASPSGKLAFTMAWDYEDWPTAENFSFQKEQVDHIRDYDSYGLDGEANGSIGFLKSPVTLYQEGIYMGYRYFDSFGVDVAYPFGFGLSYGEFSISDWVVKKIGFELEITARVKNISSHGAGKEVVEVYVSSPAGRLEQPYQCFAGCGKTHVLSPGQEEDVTISIPVGDIASYEEETASWVLEAGRYWVRVGNSSRNTHIVCCLMVEHKVVCQKVKNILPLCPANKGKIQFLSAKGAVPFTYQKEEAEKNSAPVLFLTQKDVPQTNAKEEAGNQPYPILKQLSAKELAAMTVGYGPGLPFGGAGGKYPCTIQDEEGRDITEMTHSSQALGYVSPALTKYGIPSVRYKDGPAGVGMTAWPSAMLLACCFDRKLLRAFGEACGYEAALQGVDSWLAPGLNLHRNPLGGRNFEYFSEDPYLTGLYGIEVSVGAAKNPGVTACPKHLALNEQETFRRGSSRLCIDAVDSIVEERTARELYLKPFEMTVKNSPINTIMTSFNKINGVFAAGSKDLCTKLLREEWGFCGAVITDWGDMDTVVDGADGVAAGNDVIMPGGPPVICQILDGLEKGRITREELLDAVSHFLYFVKRSHSFQIWKNGCEECERL